VPDYPVVQPGTLFSFRPYLGLGGATDRRSASEVPVYVPRRPGREAGLAIPCPRRGLAVGGGLPLPARRPSFAGTCRRRQDPHRTYALRADACSKIPSRSFRLGRLAGPWRRPTRTKTSASTAEVERQATIETERRRTARYLTRGIALIPALRADGTWKPYTRDKR